MSTGNSIFWFIAGAVAGAMTAVLLVPDTREKAKGKIAEGLEILEKALEEK